MHPSQVNLLSTARKVTASISEKSAAPKNSVLWRYTDDEGNDFYLLEKKLSVKSPYTGKIVSGKPEKFTPSQLGNQLKSEN